MNTQYEDEGWDDILDRMAQGMGKERKTKMLKADTVAFCMSTWKNRVHYLEGVGFRVGSNIRKQQILHPFAIFSTRAKWECQGDSWTLGCRGRRGLDSRYQLGKQPPYAGWHHVSGWEAPAHEQVGEQRGWALQKSGKWRNPQGSLEAQRKPGQCDFLKNEEKKTPEGRTSSLSHAPEGLRHGHWICNMETNDDWGGWQC